MGGDLLGENFESDGRSSTAQSVRNIFRKDRGAESNAREMSTGTQHPLWNHAETDQSEGFNETRHTLQTFGLAKNEDYLISPTVHCIKMGFGWDRDADVDASVALFDDQKRAVDTVWCKKLQSNCGCVLHSGDNLTRIGEGDDEVMTVELADLPLHIHYLLFIVCIFSRDVSFSQIRSAYVRMMHGKEGLKSRELCYFSFTEMSGHAMVVGFLTRNGPRWNFRALGIPATGGTIHELLRNPDNLKCLDCNPSYSPEMRHVTARVIKGTGLAAKQVSGFFKKTYSSDPYFTVTFKGKRYTSEHRPQTLEPEWNSPPLQVGWINEVETKALKVQVFNSGAIGADDFMGVVQISGRALYHLGRGKHTFWFELGTSKRREHTDLVVSGKILIQFRIDINRPNCCFCQHPCVHLRNKSKPMELHSVESMQSEGTTPRTPLESSAHDQVSIQMNTGKTSLEYAALGQDLVCAILPVFEEHPIAMSLRQEKKTIGRNQSEVVRCTEKLAGNEESQEMRDADGDSGRPSVSIQQKERQMVADFPAFLRQIEDPCGLETESHTEESTITEQRQSTSDGEDSSSSDAGMWIPDEPYGSKGRLLTAVSALRPGQDFADDYTMGISNFARRAHLRLAKQNFGKEESVVLKFYWDEESLENAIEKHKKVAGSENVCRIVQTLKTTKTGHPPCLAFERGTPTASEWLLGDRPLFDRTWCLSQILTGLRDLHAEGIAHCDVKPSNVVFFSESVKWKLIDLDGAQKAGESRAVCFTAPYASPEVLRCWLEEGQLPVAQKAADIWSCGILAYEVLTGYRMFGDDLTHDEIYEFVLEGRVEEKLDLVMNVSHREAISKFLKLDPAERWSAGEALQHAAFQSDSQTTWTQV